MRRRFLTVTRLFTSDPALASSFRQLRDASAGREFPKSKEEDAMSRIFGDMRQIGIVVKDIDKAMRHWVEVCGIGPWFYAEKLPLTAYSYKGVAQPIPHLSIALANSGDIQLELIQQK